MKGRRSRLAGAGLAVALGLIGAGSAHAAAFTHSTTGVSMNGSYVFEPQSVRQGAFHFWGTLNDTLNDGHAGKQQVRIEGYGYNTYYAPVDADKYLNQYIWAAPQLYVTKARAKVCRDRGTLLPDNCSAEKTYTR